MLCIKKKLLGTNRAKQVKASRPWPPEGPGKPCRCRLFPGVGQYQQQFVQPAIPAAYKDKIYEQSKCQMSGDTIYRKSYLTPRAGCAAVSARPQPAACCPIAFEKNTIHKLSYQDNGIVRKRSPLPGCKRKLIGGEGPAQDITTHRHDYVPQPGARSEPFKLKNYDQPAVPMEHLSTNRADYQWPPFSKADLCQFGKNNMHCKFPVERKTVHNQSFLPFDKQPPKITIKKKDLIPSPQKVEDNTVYRMSFGPPIRVLSEDTKGDPCPGGCRCTRPGQCLVSLPQQQDGQDECMCQYPKAALPN